MHGQSKLLAHHVRGLTIDYICALTNNVQYFSMMTNTLLFIGKNAMDLVSFTKYWQFRFAVYAYRHIKFARS